MRTLLSLPVLALLTLGCGSSDPGGGGGGDPGGAAGRPAARLLLSDAVLSKLHDRAAANDPLWTALRGYCDMLAKGKVEAPNGTESPDLPNTGSGYQGSDYLQTVYNLGLCYRVVLGVDPTREMSYGAAGVQLMTAISTPQDQGGAPPMRDDGYGIRNYGTSMAFGLDWFYPALPSDLRARLIDRLDEWFTWFDMSGFSHNDPIGNYFAGYLIAKTAAALAGDGEGDKPAKWWSDVEGRMWGMLVEPQYIKSMKGGGWPEGWQYGPLSVFEMAEFFRIAKTAKALPWMKDIDFYHDQALYLTHFTWPSTKHIEDQGTVHTGDSMQPPAFVMVELAGLLESDGDKFAPTARSFAKAARAVSSDKIERWQQLLFIDDSLPEEPYTQLPLSYFAPGPGHVAMRSTWDPDAVWASFVSGPYIDYVGSGEQYYNQGSVTVVQGDTPIIVNATGQLPLKGGQTADDYVYKNLYQDPRTRDLFNQFFVNDTANRYNPGQGAVTPDVAKTHIERYEDGDRFVRARGANIEDMYQDKVVSQYLRDMVYLRPNMVVVYDRTTVSGADKDQWLSWHVPVAPTAGAAADATTVRQDLGTLGSVRTLLPKSAVPKIVNLPGNVVWRLEMHAPSHEVAHDWLTVISVGATVSEQVRLSNDDGNVTAGQWTGVQVQAARNEIVLFAADHAGATMGASAHYVVTQTADADHLLVDLAPGGYAVTATPAGAQLAVDVKAGGTFMASANGTLSFRVSMSGAVSP